MYNNKREDPIWCYSTFTRSGAIGLANLMKEKFGCKLFEQPILRDDGMWMIMFSNPLMKESIDEV